MSDPKPSTRLEEILSKQEEIALPEGAARETEAERMWVREIIHALEEREITLEELSEEALKRAVRLVSMDALIDAVSYKQEDDVVKEPDSSSVVIGKIGWARPLALAAALGLLVIGGVAYFYSSQPDSPGSGGQLADGVENVEAPLRVNLEVAWDDLPPLEAFGSWHALPDSPEEVYPILDAGGAVTMGPGASNERNQFKMSTVIVRSDGGFGSGVIVDTKGWIISNYHVVEMQVQEAALRGETAKVEIILPQLIDGRVRGNPEAVAAQVMRVDPTADLALIRLAESIDGLRAAEIASAHPQEGDEVIVVGSPAGQPAWQVRYADITSVFQFPEELSQHVAQAGTSPVVFDRERPKVVQSTADISYGDSGGPLFNEDGQVVAITFATPSNLSSGSVGFHVALPHILELMANRPSEPEVVPPDLWTAASAGLQRQGPDVERSPRGDRVASVRFIFRPVRQHPLDDSSRSIGEPHAMLQFVDQEVRLEVDRISESSVELMPKGLWAMEDQGSYDWSFAVLQIRNGPALAAYTDENGHINEIRVGSAPRSQAEITYTRDSQGRWSVERSEGGARVPVLNDGLAGSQGSGGPQSKDGPNAPLDGDAPGRGPNVIR